MVRSQEPTESVDISHYMVSCMVLAKGFNHEKTISNRDEEVISDYD